MSSSEMILERMKLLYDYEVFHIGLYAALASVMIGFRQAKSKDYAREPKSQWVYLPLLLAVVFMVIAGVSGAIVATSVIDIQGRRPVWVVDPNTMPTNWSGQQLNWWWVVQHTAFWSGVLITLCYLPAVFFPEFLQWLGRNKKRMATARLILFAVVVAAVWFGPRQFRSAPMRHRVVEFRESKNNWVAVLVDGKRVDQFSRKLNPQIHRILEKLSQAAPNSIRLETGSQAAKKAK